uniref:regulator of G-protein signaling 12b isoform X1 n=1 Tax=Doryrhamphus excisus TaxID=161450 RepID=UPI0025AE5E78|nr:regulator of G-protein signaling 12b isoform X1 [Doryrhamphus excisus]XP_057932514.1 regulator of G-protein signaling 12b isoform X1 [Doryrhamphus excisus]
MFKQADTSSRRRPHGGNDPIRSQSPPPSVQQRRIRTVEVARGRTGYGFTLSGQNPCVLSCILKGSPADYVGLRSGDHVLSVNDINVSKASHEDVVKLVGRCTGVLKLVIGETERHRRHHHQQRSAGSRHHSSNAMAASYQDSCSSDDELDGLYDNSINNNNNSARAGCGVHGVWFRPKLDSKQLGINRAERVVAELQSGGIFNMIFENSSHSSSSSDKERPAHTSSSKPRPSSDAEFPAYRNPSNPVQLSEEEMAQVLNDDSVFLDTDFQRLHLHHHQQDMDVGDGRDLVLEPSQDIVNVGMIVGYLGSIELASTGTSLESDSLQAIRGCMRRLRAEHKIHSLVLMKVMYDSVRLCNDRGQILAMYPAEKLAFSACCPDDRRFFGLVTMQATDDCQFNRGRYDEGGLRTSCHVFIVDPDLCHHQVHLGVARRFGFECTPEPDTGGCLEFPPSSQSLLHFVSVLYRDMGDNIEGVRARAFHDPDNDAQQNHSTSSNSDSGIGNFLPEEKSNRVLLVDLGGPPNHNHVSGPRQWDSPPSSQQAWSPTLGVAASHPPPPPPAIRNGHYLADLPHPLPLAQPDVPARHPRGVHPHHYSQGKWGGAVGGGDKRGAGGGAEPQRWLPVHVLRDWHQQHHHLQGLSSDQESYAESTDGWSSANCSTLPPPMNKIPADRYRAPLVPGEHLPPPGGCQPPPPLHTQTHTHRLAAQKDEWAKKLFGAGDNEKKRGGAKDAEKKAGRFRGLTMGFPPLAPRSSARRSFGRSKRLSLARSLDDLESTAVSDGELNSVELQGCSSDNSLNSNASLPSVQSHRRHTERRVASWAVCFERLLQDPVGVRYFSEFLKKEFSEENILFWQACEFFSHVPENDKKQLSQRAREIYNSFLSSKATTPVNIDSQAQLADDILNAPRPDMFKEQQLQIFNLMKFDSYTRFLKSLLYQECMLAEVEGRPLPDPYHIPSSPTSKHSTTGSDRSNLSTPKKEDKRSKSGRSLNDDSRDDSGDRRKGMFFSWSRNRSFGKGPKKRELTDFNYNFAGGRRESQGSLSSGASLELGTSVSGKNEGDVSRVGVSERGGGGGSGSAPLRQCNINLPDGSCCSVPLRAGVSIRDLLLGLCEKLCINLAAIDLFLVGGEKPLVLDQDCMTLCSRDLRLEKRTLFRLDLVPINRSVGLKAKPTKPVTEVLRPVVAKYGLHLSDLVARISGESEPLDLGLPISNLDGLRVVLDIAEHTPGKAPSKSHIQASPSRNQSTTGEDRQSRKAASAHPHGENGKAGPSLDTSSHPLPNHSVSLHKAPEKRKQKKINIDEAEEFFDLISKAQSNRADDQRGLLNKSDLQLPDFLRLSPVVTNRAGPPSYDPEPGCSTPYSRNSGNSGFPSGRLGNKTNHNDRGSGSGHFLNASYQSQSLDSALGSDSAGWADGRPPSSLFPATISPIHPSREAHHGAFKDTGRAASVQMLEEDALSDLTLVGEAELNSPSLNYVTLSALQSKPHARPRQQSQDGRPSSGTSPV